MLTDEIKYFTYPDYKLDNLKAYKLYLRDNICGVSHVNVKKCTGLNISPKTNFKYIMKIQKDKLFFNYKDEIDELFKDSKKLDEKYKEIVDTNTTNSCELPLTITKRILGETFQQLKEYDSIDVMKMLNSKKMSNTVEKFRYIIPLYIREIVLKLVDDPKN